LIKCGLQIVKLINLIFKFIEKLNNKNSLSCAACFNQISYESQSIKHFPNIMFTNETTETFIDYLETYNSKELIQLINDSTLKGKIHENKFQLLNLDTNSDFKNYVSVKCSSCYTILGVYNPENKKYIIFNSI
jgi:hypothetical protein